VGLDVVGQLESPCAPLLFILLYTIKEASILDVAGRLDTAVRTLSAMKSVDGLALADLNSQVAADGRYCEITVNRSNTDLEAFTQMRCHSSFRPWWTTSSHASPISSFRKLAQC